MESQIWVVSTLLISIVLIVLTIVKLKFHPFLALLLASFFVGAMMGMGPLEMVNAIESGIGGTLGFLAAVIGLGTILGKMMEVSGAAERIGLTLQRCRWLSADVIMVLVGLICGITLFVAYPGEGGVREWSFYILGVEVASGSRDSSASTAS